ncbi:hypothetical protein [Nostoc favosum]|uniref:Tyr recombinase domain-containing protein n=3 Tax=Bacteria TaxID=2 RepID=A0ABS8IIQ7_9NOSO|nr:hypothetical protein [Nostoc favosum CHAB5714]
MRRIIVRKISDFCKIRVSAYFPPNDVQSLQQFLSESYLEARYPPRLGHGFNWYLIGKACDIDPEGLIQASKDISAIFELVVREIKKLPTKPTTSNKRQTLDGSAAVPIVVSTKRIRIKPQHIVQEDPLDQLFPARIKPGTKPKSVVEFPEALWATWEDPETFHGALRLHMDRHGDTTWSLTRAIIKPSEKFDRKTFWSWMAATRAPRNIESFEVLERIERRYQLPAGYFKAKLPHKSRAAYGFKPVEIADSERRRLAWHLPDDFESRPINEQEKILAWVRGVIVSGATDYRRFQAIAMKQRYAISFRNPIDRERLILGKDADPELDRASVEAPIHLRNQMNDLLRFKTATLVAYGYQRNGIWGEETASQKVEHLGLLFGALVASESGPVRGLGVAHAKLTFGLLAFPSVWDWYLRWREQRRGFYTSWEIDMLRLAIALTRPETGWLRQTPSLAKTLSAIDGLISATDIESASSNWHSVCDACHKHCLTRAKEIQKVARVHRDAFEPILPILESDSPVAEYRKITDEIVRLMPDEKRYPKSAAESVRSILMLRLGLHLGLRQKNLRQLLLCRRHELPRSERQLVELKRGELRWNNKEMGWEVFIPAIAFKNADSSYFANKPFRLILPNLAGLYECLEQYIERHRACLLSEAADPGTLFIKTVKSSSEDASYDRTTFYEAWRLIIQRYGIYNPFTKRGAIKGLLPHGPHNVRDVLATHILKKTGSYEQASYAIQDTPDTVAKHYGRFLPFDKAALAAKVLNEVWEAG